MSAKAFGDLIKAGRLRLEWTQEDLASRLPIKRETLSQWERGIIRYAPQPEVVGQLSRILGVPEIELLHGLGYLKNGQDGVVSPERLAALRALQLTQEEEDALAAFRSLPPDLRLVMIRLIRAGAREQSDR